MELNEAVMKRRSIRKYKPDPISEETLNTLLESVRKAPSWANTQCWRLVVVRDNDIKARMADCLFAFGGKPSHTAEAMKIAPVAIAFCAEIGKSGYTFKEPREPATDKGDYWYMFDVALAMENLALSAVSMGLGTVIVGAFDPHKVAEVLKVPPEFAVVALTPLGCPDESPDPRPRKEIPEIVFYDQFGQGK
jgi:nitroreductase